MHIINIHPGITDEEITNIMRQMNDKTKYEKYQGKELWVFFDEINTCLKENIRLIGACNPYRKRKESTERYGNPT